MKKIKKCQNGGFTTNINGNNISIPMSGILNQIPQTQLPNQLSYVNTNTNIGNASSFNPAQIAGQGLQLVTNLIDQTNRTYGSKSEANMATFNNTLSNASTGASIGMTVGGPVGAVVGGVAGAATGLIGSEGEAKSNGFYEDPTLSYGSGIRGWLSNSDAKKEYDAIKKRISGNKISKTTGELANYNFYRDYDNNITLAASGGNVSDLAYLDDGELFMTPDYDINYIPEQGKPTDSNLLNLPNNTKVLSDKIKVPGTKETFAELGKRLMSKESKYMDKYAEGAAKANKINDSMIFDKLFEYQESLKNNKDDNKLACGGKTKSYACGGKTKKYACGGKVKKYAEGGNTDDDWTTGSKTGNYALDFLVDLFGQKSQRPSGMMLGVNKGKAQNYPAGTVLGTKSTARNNKSQRVQYDNQAYNGVSNMRAIKASNPFIRQVSEYFYNIDDMIGMDWYGISDAPTVPYRTNIDAVSGANEASYDVPKTIKQEVKQSSPTKKYKASTKVVPSTTSDYTFDYKFTPDLSIPDILEFPTTRSVVEDTVQPQVSSAPATQDIPITGKSSDTPSNFDFSSLLTDIASLSPVIANMFVKPEQFDAITNPYTPAINRAMLNRKYNVNPTIQQILRNRNTNNYSLQNVNTGTGQNLAFRLQNAVNTNRAINEAYANAALQNNIYAADYANALNNTGQQWVEALRLSQDQNARSRAAAGNINRTALTQLSQYAQNKELMRNQSVRDSAMLDLYRPLLEYGYTPEQFAQLMKQYRKGGKYAG